MHNAHQMTLFDIHCEWQCKNFSLYLSSILLNSVRISILQRTKFSTLNYFMRECPFVERHIKRGWNNTNMEHETNNAVNTSLNQNILLVFPHFAMQFDSSDRENWFYHLIKVLLELILQQFRLWNWDKYKYVRYVR